MSKTTDKIIRKAIEIGDDILGRSARKLKVQAQVLGEARDLGSKGIPRSTVNHAKKLSEAATKRSLNTRVKTVVGLAAAGTTGFMGLHKYHQHNDNKILARIDKMYENE